MRAKHQVKCTGVFNQAKDKTRAPQRLFAAESSNFCITGSLTEKALSQLRSRPAHSSLTPAECLCRTGHGPAPARALGSALARPCVRTEPRDPCSSYERPIRPCPEDSTQTVPLRFCACTKTGLRTSSNGHNVFFILHAESGQDRTEQLSFRGPPTPAPQLLSWH